MWRRQGASARQAAWAVARDHSLLRGAVARYARLAGCDAAAVRARLDALVRATVAGGDGGGGDGDAELPRKPQAATGDAWDVATTQAPPLPRESHAARARARDATRDATRDAVRDAAPVPPLSALEYEAKLEPPDPGCTT